MVLSSLRRFTAGGHVQSDVWMGLAASKLELSLVMHTLSQDSRDTIDYHDAPLTEGELDRPGGPHRAANAAYRPLTISVVIPTKNEARNIGWVLERMDPMVDEVIIVDGLSVDGTIAAARAVRPDVVVVEHPVPGKGEAVRAGFAAATGDLVVMLDADGSMDPGEIIRYVEALVDGHDFVKGSRYLSGGGTSDITLLRTIGNGALTRLANLLFGTSYSELCYGYMAFRRTRIRELDLTSTGFEIETEIVLKARLAGLAIVEVPSFESPRRHGVSNLHTFRDGWRVLRTLLRHRFANPIGSATGEPEES